MLLNSYKEEAYGRYGTQALIDLITMVAAQWHQKYPNGPRIGIGHLSLQNGGKFSKHLSHQNGLDVDIRYVRKDGKEASVTVSEDAYSRELTQELINLFLNNGVIKVKHIFSADTTLKGVTEESTHRDHMHIRIYDPDGTDN